MRTLRYGIADAQKRRGVPIRSVLVAVMMILTACTPLIMATGPVAAETFGDFEYQLINGDTEVEITGYSYFGAGGEVVIPDTINGLPVTSIGDYAFEPFFGSETIITKIFIPNGVTYIGQYAFSGCGLVSAVIPGSVITIGAYAFSRCDALISVTISDGVQNIGPGAFRDCTALASVVIPNSVISIGYYAFMGCNLESIFIPQSVSSIGEGAFQCASLQTFEVDENNAYFMSADGILYNEAKTTLIMFPCGRDGSFVIPDGLTIAAGAFIGSTLTSVTIPGSMVSISASAFSGCTALTTVIMQNGIKTIGGWAFEGCTALSSVNLPDSIEVIDQCAFYGCAALSSITIPPSVTTIGRAAFWGSGLTSVTIPGKVEDVGDGAFANCQSLTTVKIMSGVKTIGYQAFSGCPNLVSVLLPDSITTIGVSAFADCTSLKSITIPRGVINIDNSAFSGCSSLNSINVNQRNSQFSSIDGVLYNKAKTTLIRFPYAKGGSFVVPPTVRTIGAYAFYGCYQLTSLKIPGTVKNIEEGAAYGCYSLKTLIIQDGVENIDDFAFYAALGLISLTVPGSVKDIGSYAFFTCEGLRTVTIQEGVESIGTQTFYGCGGLISVALPDSLTSIGDLAFYGCFLKSVTIPRSVTSIGTNAFAWCGSLTQVYFEGDAPDTMGDGWLDGHNDVLTIYYLHGATGFTNPWHDVPTVELTKKSLISTLKGSAQTAIDDITVLISEPTSWGIQDVSSKVQAMIYQVDFAENHHLLTKGQAQSLTVWAKAALRSLDDASTNLDTDPAKKTANELKSAKSQLSALLLKINSMA